MINPSLILFATQGKDCYLQICGKLVTTNPPFQKMLEKSQFKRVVLFRKKCAINSADFYDDLAISIFAFT